MLEKNQFNSKQKTKDSEIKKYPLHLEKNNSKDFSLKNLIKTELNRRVYDFSVHYKTYHILILMILPILKNI